MTALPLNVLPIPRQLVELIDDLSKHQNRRPNAPDDYLANVDHLRIEMGRWVAHDAALRLVIGEKFVELALLDRRLRGQVTS